MDTERFPGIAPKLAFPCRNQVMKIPGDKSGYRQRRNWDKFDGLSVPFPEQNEAPGLANFDPSGWRPDCNTFMGQIRKNNSFGTLDIAMIEAVREPSYVFDFEPPSKDEGDFKGSSLCYSEPRTRKAPNSERDLEEGDNC